MNHAATPSKHSHLEPSGIPSNLPLSITRASDSEYSVTSALSEAEARVLTALSDAGHCLTLGQLRARTGIMREELKPILDGLRNKGMTAKLNTVVESYSCRFPGVRVDDV